MNERNLAVIRELQSQVEQLKNILSIIVMNAKIIPDPAMNGSTDCYSVPLDDIDMARTASGSTIRRPAMNAEEILEACQYRASISDLTHMLEQHSREIFALGRKAGLKEALEIISLTPYVTIAAAIRQRIER